jgi:hypothetical protein
MANINVATLRDWECRAYYAEEELHYERIKLGREKRKNQRYRNQIDEYVKALASSTQQCQFLSNTNLALSREYQKAKLMIETLEAVIIMLYKLSPTRDSQKESS